MGDVVLYLFAPDGTTSAYLTYANGTNSDVRDLDGGQKGRVGPPAAVLGPGCSIQSTWAVWGWRGSGLSGVAVESFCLRGSLLGREPGVVRAG